MVAPAGRPVKPGERSRPARSSGAIRGTSIRGHRGLGRCIRLLEVVRNEPIEPSPGARQGCPSSAVAIRAAWFMEPIRLRRGCGVPLRQWSQSREAVSLSDGDTLDQREFHKEVLRAGLRAACRTIGSVVRGLPVGRLPRQVADQRLGRYQRPLRLRHDHGAWSYYHALDALGPKRPGRRTARVRPASSRHRLRRRFT